MLVYFFFGDRDKFWVFSGGDDKEPFCSASSAHNTVCEFVVRVIEAVDTSRGFWLFVVESYAFCDVENGTILSIFVDVVEFSFIDVVESQS